MQDSIERAIVLQVDEARRSQSLTQGQVAAACGMTQGHYSKLVAGTIPVGTKALDAFRDWLGEDQGAREREMVRLAASIRDGCARLVALAGLNGVGDGGE